MPHPISTAAKQKPIMTNQVFSLVKDVSESFTLLSHNTFGDGSYGRGVRCGAKFNLEACEEARLDCSGEGNFDVLCAGILGDHLQARLPDGKNLIPSFPWIAPGWRAWVRIQS